MCSGQAIKTDAELDDFESLAGKTYMDHLNQDRVSTYFDAFARQSEVTQEHQLRYLQLKYFYSQDKWLYLNQMAEIFLKRNKRSLAYMCLVESLRLNPKQLEIKQLVGPLRGDGQTKFHQTLKKSQCEVSVIMATYNRTEGIRESIESVLGQAFKDFELVIINDGGTDAVEDIVRSYGSPKIKYYKLEENRGLSAALNFGISMAEGKYVTYLDDDDIYYSDHLETLLSELKNTGLQFAYANTQGVEGNDINGKFVSQCVRFVWDEEFDRNKLAEDIYIGTCAVMHEREIVNDIGMFNEDLHMSMDWDYWLRCAQKYEFTHVKKNTSEYRLRVNNVTLQNRLGGYFYGELVCRYNAFLKGEVAHLKCLLNTQNSKQAKEVYDGLREKFATAFHTPEMLEEMLNFSIIFNDSKSKRRSVKKFFKRTPRKCLMFIWKNKSVSMLLNILPQLPGKIVHYGG